MPDVMLEKFAKTLVKYSLAIVPGDLLMVRTTTLAVPLLREVYREALNAGANVFCKVNFEGETETFYGAASEAQLDWVSPIEKLEMESVSTRLSIQAPFNTRATAGVNPAHRSRHIRAQNPITDIHRKRSAAGEIRWCGTLFPTNALAQEAGMSLADYQQFVFGAMFLDKDDPIAAWQAFSKAQQDKVDYLNRVKKLRFVAEDTDLTLSVEGRTWMNSDGKRNFPSGEVFTGPVEDSANGTIRFTYPAIHGGHEVENVRVTFESGRVVDAQATRGLDHLLEELETDSGARFLGEVAIGNNYGIQRFTKNILFDEKIGGTCHLALGASYPETGGKNESALHWDMVCDLRQGGEIFADGQLIHKDGKWTI
jgi:aminopeptidase